MPTKNNKTTVSNIKKAKLLTDNQLKQKLIEADKIPPGKKKNKFIKKIAYSFAKGLALAGGIAVGGAIVYGLNKQTIQSEFKGLGKISAEGAVNSLNDPVVNATINSNRYSNKITT